MKEKIKKVRFTKNDDDLILKYINKGLKIYQIASIFKRTNKAVYERYNIYLNPKYNRKKLTQQEKTYICWDYFIYGLRCNEIARKTGRHTKFIQLFIDQERKRNNKILKSII